MTAKKANILLRRNIPGAPKSLKNYHKTRYEQRARNAKELELNFRFRGDLIRKHGVREFLLKVMRYNTLVQGVCLCCNNRADMCSCEIEVTPITGTTEAQRIERGGAHIEAPHRERIEDRTVSATDR